MLVRDHMSREVITITADQSLHMVKERLRKHDVRRLPVVQDGMLVGIVTDGDVRRALASPISSLSTHEWLYLFDRLTVAEVMTPQPLTVTPETSLVEAARLLYTRRIGGLPVVVGGTVVGIITESDMLRALIAIFASSTEEPVTTGS